MTRVLLAVVAVMISASGCTLLLPTDDLIKPCTVDADCDAQFECKDNACLPIDQDATAAEGEGEGE